MLRNTSPGPGFNNKMDMWSFGCIAYELLTGRKAFSDDFQTFDYSRSKKKPTTYFKHTDSVTKFYISDLFELEPDNRPSARELLKLKFIGERPLANPTPSTSGRAQKKRRLEQQAIPQSEFLTATLEWADSNADTKLILTMIGCGINPKHRMNSDGMSLLMRAISLRSLEVMEWFRRDGFKDVYPTLRQAIVLGVAPSPAEEGQWEVANRLVEYASDSTDGWTILHSAAQRGHRDMVEWFVKEAKADVESKDNVGRTPLSRAAAEGHLDIVKFLVEEGGADVESKSNTGWTPLSFAAFNGHLEVVEFLVDEGGADVESKDIASEESPGGRTPLSFAAMNGHLDVAKFLVEEAGADVESKSNTGWTPLSCAAMNGHLDVVEFLVDEGGADVESKDKYGRTPLSWAAFNGDLEVVEFLVNEGGADVESKSNSGQTPLSHAAGNGHLDVVEFLVNEGGADVESKDREGNTALDLARQGIRERRPIGDREGRKAVAAWLESRITNHRSRANANAGG